ncbi:hypothetical protein B0H11DRAFT_2322459 [Mycena galericulata]|nr:hypothetical protein B0H11DRAFT_2322459 [Mycena galericulata]
MSDKIYPLTQAQSTELGTLQQAAARILQTAVPTVSPPLVPDTEMALFTTRLHALPGQLTNLLNGTLFVINDSLPESNAASARTRDNPPSVESVQLRSKLLDPNAANTEVGRVRTLLHEVSHTLLESTVFPVKDYAYATSWAITQLGSVSPYNADTYAEVAALMAEVESNKPNFYRALSIARAQQAVFQSPALVASTASLSAALALVDLRINRAWIRAMDYASFAKRKGELPSDANSLQLLAIETQLQSWNIIGKRTGYFSWSVGLDKESIAQAKILEVAIERVKGWLTFLRVRLITTPVLDFAVEDPAGYQIDPSYRLDIPRARIQLSNATAATLADAISLIMLDKAFAETNMTAAKKVLLHQHSVDLITLLISQDRAQERNQLAATLRDLGAVQVTTPLTDAVWRDVQVEANIAALSAIAEKWQRATALMDEPVYQKSPNLNGIHPRDVDTVKAVITELAAFALSANDAQARDLAVTTLKTVTSALPPKFANDKLNSKEVQALADKMLAALSG